MPIVSVIHNYVELVQRIRISRTKGLGDGISGGVEDDLLADGVHDDGHFVAGGLLADLTVRRGDEDVLPRAASAVRLRRVDVVVGEALL